MVTRIYLCSDDADADRVIAIDKAQFGTAIAVDKLAEPDVAVYDATADTDNPARLDLNRVVAVVKIP